MSSSLPGQRPQTTRKWISDAGALFDLALEKDPPALGMAGPYRLLEPLGEGGLGVVWRAEQTQPVRRIVALKLIRPGLQLHPDVLARFELERQTLARMNHPGIAAMYDSGTTEDGRPWFAMELVEGEPLTTFCHRHQLPSSKRVALFILVCEAVQHAHQKGVIHRDLKPSNILVKQADGKPIPKVIDFGIARLLEPSSDNLFATRIGQAPSATYAYMSPEQAARDSSSIDTRSDIYTLGVILFELLCGKLPMPQELIKSQDFVRMARWILESDPPRPTSPQLRGELGWIASKAMAREPARRYASAAALGEDLLRYLEDKPVQASPPSVAYQLLKWIKRHRVIVAAAAIALTSLVTALLFSRAALKREKLARSEEIAQRIAAESAKEVAINAQHQAEAARDEAQTARQVASTARAQAESLMNQMLFDLRDKAKRIGRLDLLDEVSQNAEAYFAKLPAENETAEQARQRAAMHQNRGAVLAAQGRADDALKHFRTSVEIVRRLLDETPSDASRRTDLAIALQHLGDACQELGFTEQAEAHYLSMLSVLQNRGRSDPLSTAHERLGDLALAQHDRASAKKHYEDGLAATPPESELHIAMLEQRLGEVSQHLGEATAAERWFTSGHQRLQGLLESAPDDADLMAAEAVAAGKLANLSTGKLALNLLAHQVAAFEELYERDGINLAWRRGLSVARFQAGCFFDDSGSHRDAERHFLAALETSDDTRQRIAIHLRLAACYLRQDKKADSQQSAQKVIELIESLPQDSTLQEWLKTAKALAR